MNNNNWSSTFSGTKSEDTPARTATEQHPNSMDLPPFYPDNKQAGEAWYRDIHMVRFHKFTDNDINDLVWKPLVRSHNTNAWTNLLRIVDKLKFLPPTTTYPSPIWDILRKRHIARDISSLMIFIRGHEGRLNSATDAWLDHGQTTKAWVSSFHETNHPFVKDLAVFFCQEETWQDWWERTRADQYRNKHPVSVHYTASKGTSTERSFQPLAFVASLPLGLNSSRVARLPSLPHPLPRACIDTRHCPNCEKMRMMDNPVFHGTHCSLNDCECIGCKADDPWR